MDDAVQAIQDPTAYGAVWDDGVGLGNYWSTYIVPDDGHDDSGDIPYVFDGKHMDRYPLMDTCVP